MALCLAPNPPEKDSAMKEQRHLPALRAHIEQLLNKGWVIASRNPLTLQNGHRCYLVSHGMLIGDSTNRAA
jgi:hypothetical protein